ncbi:nucleoside phosphorylase [Streptomyces sp. NPDC003036]|uniref:nucleoside phosphorylase n=1 Tax=Streptomyces sp. NPDC003036 TaxID=3154442 RepID=UPI0033BB30F2
MSFPLYLGKHALPAVTDPGEHADYLRARLPTATLAYVDGVVLVYQRRVLDHAASAYPSRRLNWVRGGLLVLERQGRRLGVCGGFGLGAPAAALVLEQLVALGVKRVITVGTAASLRTDLPAGELVVCDNALRDEGVSYHYLPPGTHVRPSMDLSERVAEALRGRGVTVRRGTGWTTDAPYRETAAEVARYSGLGVLTADMEAAGVFTVAEYRGIDAAAVFAVTDSLVDRRPRHDRPETDPALFTALECALSALSSAARGRPSQG